MSQKYATKAIPLELLTSFGGATGAGSESVLQAQKVREEGVEDDHQGFTCGRAKQPRTTHHSVASCQATHRNLGPFSGKFFLLVFLFPNGSSLWQRGCQLRPERLSFMSSPSLSLSLSG